MFKVKQVKLDLPRQKLPKLDGVAPLVTDHFVSTQPRCKIYCFSNHQLFIYISFEPPTSACWNTLVIFNMATRAEIKCLWKFTGAGAIWGWLMDTPYMNTLKGPAQMSSYVQAQKHLLKVHNMGSLCNESFVLRSRLYRSTINCKCPFVV